ncbi:unnamed protein product [Trichobilharzia regenti]|nr:unnamed protein product [Trichobilharzia regenti]
MTQSVWDIAVQQNKSKPAQGNVETTIIFAGNRQSGKSTIINRFLEKDETPKPTLALDYTFGRKGTRAVSHIWELGGGSKLSDLIDVLITPNNILLVVITSLNLHLILVVDLSNRLRQKNVTHIQNTLNENLRKRISSTHPDVELLNPFPLPLTFLGTKYDIFRQQNLISKTIRFLSHYYGASLYFTSIREDELLKKTRILLNHIAFGGKITFNEQMKTGKPLAIPVSMDSFSNIGNYYCLFELRMFSHGF